VTGVRSTIRAGRFPPGIRHFGLARRSVAGSIILRIFCFVFILSTDQMFCDSGGKLPRI
jgi:hypothetical protein